MDQQLENQGPFYLLVKNFLLSRVKNTSIKRLNAVGGCLLWALLGLWTAESVGLLSPGRHLKPNSRRWRTAHDGHLNHLSKCVHYHAFNKTNSNITTCIVKR